MTKQFYFLRFNLAYIKVRGLLCISNNSIKHLVQSAGAVEYTDFLSAEG